MPGNSRSCSGGDDHGVRAEFVDDLARGTRVEQELHSGTFGLAGEIGDRPAELCPARNLLGQQHLPA